MAVEPDGKKLEELGSRIDAVKSARSPKPKDNSKYTSAGIAWRMVTELVVGMTMGLGIGFGLDSLFGTQPIFLLVFALLGFAAGVRVMMHTAAEVNKDKTRQMPETEKD